MSGAPARLVRMSAAFFGSSLAQMGIGLVASLIIGRGLGVAAFGQWTFLLAWAAMLTSGFDLGLSALVTRDAARDRPGAGALVAGAIAVRLAAFAPAAVLVLTAAPWFSQEAAAAQAFRGIVWLAGVGLVYGCFAAAFRAWSDLLPAILAIEAAGSLVQCLGAWWLIRNGRGVADLVTLATAVQLFQVAAALLLWSVGARSSPFAWPAVSTGRVLVRRAIPFAGVGFVSNLQARLAPLMLGYLSTPGEVAAFGVASRFANAARMLPHAGFASALPVLSHEFEEGEPEPLRREFHGAVRWFAVVAATGLALAARPILALSYGDAFAPAAPVLVWLAIALVPSLVNSSRKVYLYASGRETIALSWTLVAFLVQAAAAVVLIPSLAAVGGAVAMLLGEVAVWWPLHRTPEAHKAPDRPQLLPARAPRRNREVCGGATAEIQDVRHG